MRCSEHPHQFTTSMYKPLEVRVLLVPLVHGGTGYPRSRTAMIQAFSHQNTLPELRLPVCRWYLQA